MYKLITGKEPEETPIMKSSRHHQLCLLSIGVLLLSAAAALAQGTANGTTLIKTARGLLVVHNEQGLNFTLELNGKEVKPTDAPDYVFVQIDGRMTQVHTVGVDQFAPDTKDKKLNDWLVLEKYRDWEVDYIGNVMTTKLKVASEYLTLDQNRLALFWSFPTPTSVNAAVRTQLYLTVLNRGHVIALNCAIENNDNEAAAKKFMLATLATLKVSEKPFDVQAMQEAIRKGIM
jgi:hypothetical protein